MILKLIGRIVCFFVGHKRGTFDSLVLDAANRVTGRMIICPRCDTTWIRKGKAP